MTRKNTFFFWGVLLVKFKILHQRGKRVKTKSQKIFGANSFGCRSYREKTGREEGGGAVCPPPSWIGLIRAFNASSSYCMNVIRSYFEKMLGNFCYTYDKNPWTDTKPFWKSFHISFCVFDFLASFCVRVKSSQINWSNASSLPKLLRASFTFFHLQ